MTRREFPSSVKRAAYQRSKDAAGVAWQQHIEQITAALPFTADAPGIVSEG